MARLLEPRPWTGGHVAQARRGSTSSPAGLAWLADIVATAFVQTVGPLARATSLDNTIRFARIGLQSDWVLTDVTAEAAADGYAYGRVDCYAVDGTLLATATQTCLCRRDSPMGTDR
jgi:acyl-CoA thioesterase